MAVRYVWMGMGAALMNSMVANRIPKGFSLKPDDKGPPFRKYIDYDAWNPRVFTFTDLSLPTEAEPLPVKSQHRIMETIKVTQWKDYFGRPMPEEPKTWWKRLLNWVASPFTLFPPFHDYVVFVTTDVDDVEPYVIYYRSKWVDD